MSRVLAVIVAFCATAGFPAFGRQEQNAFAGISREKISSYVWCDVKIEDTPVEEISVYFYLSFSRCDAEFIAALWETGHVDPTVEHPLQGTLLHRIAYRDEDSPLLDELISSGIDLDATDARGRTALAIALQGDAPVVSSALVEAGASTEFSSGPFANAQEYCEDLEASMQSRGLSGRAACDIIGY